MASGLVFLLLSLLISLGQNLFSTPITYPANTNSSSSSAAIVRTVNQNQSAVVTIKGYDILSGPIIQSTSGTGFIIDNSGIILTNRHVVADGGAKYTVITGNGLRYSINSVNLDSTSDIAVVKIDPNQHQNNKLTTVNLGDSTKIFLGQEVAALGDDPGNIRPTIMTGIVSGIGETIVADDFQNQRAERLYNLIQTDLDLIPGNSGSPLFDSSGNVIGINTATSSSVPNTSYAIPINSAKNFLETVK